MFHHLKPAYSRISDDLKLDRAFAFVGLLRELDGSIPLDLVLMYLHNTDRGGLYRFFMSQMVVRPNEIDAIDPGKWSDRFNFNRKNTGNTMVVPRSLLESAQEYMARIVRENVLSGLDYSYGWFDELDTRNGWVKNNVPYKLGFPLSVRNALDAALIGHGGDLLTYSAELKGLHGALVAIPNNKKDTMNGFGHVATAKAFYADPIDVLSPSQEEKLWTLGSIGRGYASWCNSTKNMLDTLNNQVARTALCDLLDILLLVGCRRGYVVSKARKDLYEYKRLVEIGGESPVKFVSASCVLHSYDLYTGSIDAAVDLHSRMSPHAVVCLGRNLVMRRVIEQLSASHGRPKIDLRSCDYLWWTMHGEAEFKKLLKSMKRGNNVSTKLYVEAEMNCERQLAEQFVFENKKYFEAVQRDQCCEDECCAEGGC